MQSEKGDIPGVGAVNAIMADSSQGGILFGGGQPCMWRFAVLAGVAIGAQAAWFGRKHRMLQLSFLTTNNAISVGFRGHNDLVASFLEF